MKTVRLITCDNITEAYLLKGRLANEGIDCVVTNQNFTNLIPTFNHLLGAGIQILVNEYDFSKAKEIIKDKIEPVNDKLICSNCGSEDIGLGLGKKKGLKILIILLTVFLWIPFGNLKPKFYCKSCGDEIK